MQLSTARRAGRLDSLRASFLLDGLPDPAWLIGADGVLLDCNAGFLAFARAMGRDVQRDELFQELIAGSEHEALWLDLWTRVRAGRSVAADARITAFGIERAYTIHGTPAHDAAFFVARELTVPHTLRDDSHELALTRLFTAEPTLHGALTSAITFLCASDAWAAGVVWLVDDAKDKGKGELSASAIWLHDSLAHAGEFREKVESLRFARGHGLPGRAWAAGDVVWVADLFDETALTRKDAAARSGLHTVIAVPMTEGEQTLGVIELFDRVVRPINATRKQSLKRAGAAIGRLVERRRSEDERRRLITLVERKGKEWALTFDAIRQPIFLTARDGSIVRLNKAALDLTTSADYVDVIGRPIGSLGDNEPWVTLRDVVTAVAQSGELCTAHIENDNAIFDVEASLDAEEQRVILSLRDTTEVVRLQESVRRGEQLAALGELVAGVAHQVKNPLFGMSMTVDLLDERAGGHPQTEELFDALRKWLHRLDRLMESLLAYGKTWTIDLRPLGVKEVIEQAIDICRPAASSSSVRVDFRVDADAIVLMDPQRLAHAFENLITNAIQYSPAQSTAEVTLTADEGGVEVVVADRGPGFREDDLSRIFEPFFTRRRGGTGLGLSVVQRVVDEHGGIVTAENCKPNGAKVRIRLPRYDERTAARGGTSHSDRG